MLADAQICGARASSGSAAATPAHDAPVPDVLVPDIRTDGPRRVRALGFDFDPLSQDDLLDRIYGACARRERLVLAGANLHGLYMYETVPSYRALLARPESAVIIDGMPIVWLLRSLGHDVRRCHRTTWVDWLPMALARAAREHRRVYILGHSAASLEAGLAKAAILWPELEISGHHGFFDTANQAECEKIIDSVNSFAPDFLIVGMGMPRQEDFVNRYATRISAPVIGLGGAAFGYLAGEQRTPPRWMGRAGLEWAHRLSADPRRLAGRYLLEPLLLAACLARRLIRETFMAAPASRYPNGD